MHAFPASNERLTPPIAHGKASAHAAMRAVHSATRGRSGLDALLRLGEQLVVEVLGVGVHLISHIEIERNS